MVLFNNENKITKYEQVQDIITTFYNVRIDYYKMRKEYLLSKILRDVDILSNKVKFILGVVNGHIELRNPK